MNWYTEEIEILIRKKAKSNSLGIIQTEYESLGQFYSSVDPLTLTQSQQKYGMESQSTTEFSIAYHQTIHDLAIIQKKQLFIRFEGLLYRVDRSLYYPTFYCLDACLSFASTRIDEDV